MDSIEIMETILDKKEEIKKYLAFYIDYVNHPHLFKLQELLENNKELSKEFLDELVKEAKQNQKLFQWIEILLEKF